MENLPGVITIMPDHCCPFRKNVLCNTREIHSKGKSDYIFAAEKFNMLCLEEAKQYLITDIG